MFLTPDWHFSEYVVKLSELRPADWEERAWEAAGWIGMVGEAADYVVTNRFREDPRALEWTAGGILKESGEFFHEDVGFPLLETPFEISPGVGGVSPVLSWHEAQLARPW